VHKDTPKSGSKSSPIQTVLSVPDSHWVNRCAKHQRVTDLKRNQLLTVGREFHPAPKIGIIYFDLSIVYIK